ncbi:MAG TPA: hypothetical protein PKI53_06350 [Candidatus Aminicenantes bacterium]|nr:hypothetical protein [Candidatus Aminicenantes bacterium]HNT32322.1 hypothetical protein [Candidatus Aminicenantes bacterium]
MSVDFRPLAELQQLLEGLDAPVLGHPKKDDPVDGQLNREVQVVQGQAGIAEGDVAGQDVAPAFDFLQEFGVHLRRAALPLGGRVLVERSRPDRLAGEHVPQLPEAVGVFFRPEILDAGVRRLLARFRPRAAIIDAQLLKIRQDGEGDPRAEAVPAELVGRPGIEVDIDAAFFSLGEEFRLGADPEGVIGGFLPAFDLQTVFRDDFAVLRSDHRGVAHVPAQRNEKRVDQLLADMGFFDAGSPEFQLVRLEETAQLGDFVLPLIERFAHKTLPF